MHVRNAALIRAAAARREALRVYLAPLARCPPHGELEMRFDCSATTVAHDLTYLRSRGVVVPPRTPTRGPGLIQCAVIASIKNNQRGWCVSIRGDIGRPERPQRLLHWCADRAEAFAIQHAIQAGQTIDEAILAQVR